MARVLRWTLEAREGLMYAAASDSSSVEGVSDSWSEGVYERLGKEGESTASPS